MRNLEEIKQMLTQHEGLKLKPYKCSAGYLTIGIGRNLETKGITEDEADFMLTNDILDVFSDLQSIFPNFNKFSNNWQYALIDMRFNLGPGGFRSFKRMIAAIKAYDWDKAIVEMLDSKWAEQVKERAHDLLVMMIKDE